MTEHAHKGDTTTAVAVLAEAMFRAQFSNPLGEGVDRKWAEPGVRGPYEYRAGIVIGLIECPWHICRHCGCNTDGGRCCVGCMHRGANHA